MSTEPIAFEAAKAYALAIDHDEWWVGTLLRDAFLAGAAWQAEQDRKLVAATIANPGEERRQGSRSIE